MYLTTPSDRRHNVKIRDGVLEVKQLLDMDEDLEQWQPLWQEPFPLSPETVSGRLAPALTVSVESLPAGEISEGDLVNQQMREHASIRLAQVCKRRFHYSIEACDVEFTEVLINGARLETVALESESAIEVRRLRRSFGLDQEENVNYQVMVKRVVGLLPMPVSCQRASYQGMG